MFLRLSSVKDSSHPVIIKFITIFEEFKEIEWNEREAYWNDYSKRLGLPPENKKRTPTIWKFEVCIPNDKMAPVRLEFEDFMNRSDAMMAIWEKIYPEKQTHSLSTSAQCFEVFYDTVDSEGFLSGKVFSLERRFYDQLVNPHLLVKNDQEEKLLTQKQIGETKLSPQLTNKNLQTVQLLKIIETNIHKLITHPFLPLDEAQTLSEVTDMTKRFALGIYDQLGTEYGTSSEVRILSLACGLSVIEFIAIKSIFEVINPKTRVDFVGVDNNEQVVRASTSGYKNFDGVRLISADATTPEKLAEKVTPHSFDIIVVRHPNILGEPPIFGAITTKTAPYFAKEKNCAIISCYNENEFHALTKLPRERVLFKHVHVVDANQNDEMKQITPLVLTTGLRDTDDKEIPFIMDQFIIVSELNTSYKPKRPYSHSQFFSERKSAENLKKVCFSETNITIDIPESGYQYAMELSQLVGRKNLTIKSDTILISNNWVSQLSSNAVDELCCGLGMTLDQMNQVRSAHCRARC